MIFQNWYFAFIIIKTETWALQKYTGKNGRDVLKEIQKLLKFYRNPVKI